MHMILGFFDSNQTASGLTEQCRHERQNAQGSARGTYLMHRVFESWFMLHEVNAILRILGLLKLDA